MLLGSFPRLLASGALGTIATVGYVTYCDTYRYRNMTEKFAQGNIGSLSEYDTNYFNRPKLEQKLQNILQPAFTFNYYILYGEVGTGKTRTIAEVIKREMERNRDEEGGAPVYALACKGSRFTDTLAKAVNFHFDEHINLKYLISCLLKIEQWPKRDEAHKFSRLLQAIETAVIEYKREKNKPAVLVIDGLDMLLDTENGESSVAQLQAKAKLWADTNVCRMVLITSTKKCLDFLQEDKGSWSRASQPIYIEDLGREYSVNYLTSQTLHDDKSIKQTLTKDEATKVYDLTGGRIQHLKSFKSLFEEGFTFEKSKRMILQKEQEKFTLHLRNTEMWKVIKLLMNCPKKTMLLRDLMKQTSFEVVDALDHNDIIRLQRSQIGILVKFQSKLTENVIQDVQSHYNEVKHYLEPKSYFPVSFLHYIWTGLFGKSTKGVSEVELLNILEGGENGKP